MALPSVWSRSILAYFMPNYVITIVWIPLLYNALMLPVLFWSVSIIFWNPLSNLTFWVQKIMGSQFCLYFLFRFLHYFHCTPLHGFAPCGNLFSMHVFLYLSHSLSYFNEICACLMLCILYKSSNFQAKTTIQTYLKSLEGTFHSRVKILQNNNTSIITFSSNYKGILIC